MFRMMNNVKTNYAGVKIAVFGICFYYLVSLSKHDN